MKLIRLILGKLILILDRLTAPLPLARAPNDQARIDQATAKIKLYQFESCPFCVKVRRAIRRLNLTIETRDAGRDQSRKRELIEGGGQYQVPCLRIEKDDGVVQWLYESSEIILFLERAAAQIDACVSRGP